MTQQEMMLQVPGKLKEIEKEYGIRILYAAESGSRAWKTSTENSDYDVRFIYIRPQTEYLRLDQTRDVLEFPITDSWDMSGWDLSKTLRLLTSSNSQIYEWFSSPLVYVDDGFSDRFRPVLDAYFATKTVAKHYLHQAEMKMKRIEKAEMPKLKHYLYSLQYLATARWVLDNCTDMPIGIDNVLKTLPEALRQETQMLLVRKTTQPQQKLMPHHPFLDEWLTAEYSRIAEEIAQMPRVPEQPWEMLNRFFLAELERT